jgi:uncharacterized membrane protein YjjP (DUF1212 family)
MEHKLTQRQVLDLATNIGYYIIKNGGEINRAEDTARRVGMAYGMDAVHVFAIASSIVITVVKDGETLTQTKRVKASVTDLDKIERFNELSREICNQCLSYEEVRDQIKAIEEKRRYPTWVMILAYGIIGGAYTAFFGGDLTDIMVGFVAGIVAKLAMMIFGLVKTAPFLINVVGAAAIVSILKLFTFALPGLHTEIITAGVLMNLVPGVLLTNCIRDFIATDYTAGTIKMVEAFFTAASIALGVAVSVLWR